MKGDECYRTPALFAPVPVLVPVPVLPILDKHDHLRDPAKSYLYPY